MYIYKNAWQESSKFLVDLETCSLEHIKYYRIRSIRRCGYYFFFITQFCVASIGERHLLTRDGRWRNPLPQGRWSSCRCQGVNPKRYCHACYCNIYWAQGIRSLRRRLKRRRWVGGEQTCPRRLLIHYTMLSTILNKLYLLYTLCLFWYCHRVTRFVYVRTYACYSNISRD